MIKTVAECDQILKNATEERDALVLRRSNITAMLKNTSENAIDYQAEFAAVTIERNALRALVDGLPEGSDTKDKNKIRLLALDKRHEVLRQATERNTPTEMVLRQLDVEQLNGEIKVIEDFMNEVGAHKATLGG